MELSNFIAFLALLISVASAVHTRTSAKAAQTANKIGLHQPRKEIYDGLLQFRSLFRGMDFHPTDEEIEAFYIQSVAPSHIYLEPELARQIHFIYERSYNLYHSIAAAEGDYSTKYSKWDFINPLQELGKNELEETIKAITKQIYVGHT